MTIPSDGLPDADRWPNWPNQPTGTPDRTSDAIPRPIRGPVAGPVHLATGPGTGPENPRLPLQNDGLGPVGPVGPVPHTRGGRLALVVQRGTPSPAAAARWSVRPELLAAWFLAQYREHQERSGESLDRPACSATACAPPLGTEGSKEHVAA